MTVRVRRIGANAMRTMNRIGNMLLNREKSAGRRWAAARTARATAALAAISLLGASTGRADEFGLSRGKQAALTVDKGRITFSRDPGLTLLPDPRCPNVSSIRIGTASGAGADVTLPCQYWTYGGRNKFVYEEPLGAAAGIRRVVWKSVSLQIDLGGDSFVPPPGPADLIEVEINVGQDAAGIGPHQYCGRFTEPLLNEANAMIFVGGASCFSAPGATKTFTPTPQPTPTPTPESFRVFRADTVKLVDPHTFNPCASETTALINTGLTLAINNTDLNFVIRFEPFDPSAVVGAVSVGLADCVTTSSCGESAGAPLTAVAYENHGAGATCLQALAGTVGKNNSTPYAPPAPNVVNDAGQKCWVANVPSMVLEFGDVIMPLGSVKVASRYGANPNDLTQGLLMGYLTKAAASTIDLPAPFLGTTLADHLRDGDNCPTPQPEDTIDDRDANPGGPGDGWWLYLNFTAKKITWTEP